VALGDLRLQLERVRVDADVVGVELVAGEPVEGQLGGVTAGERAHRAS
jgi:hypothetical protein